jgi:hypothetical protein
MYTLNETCMDKDSVESFCDCIGGSGSADPTAQAFCNRAKSDARITKEDLEDLKMALTDEEDESCCECAC